jgi:hypothetical protein
MAQCAYCQSAPSSSNSKSAPSCIPVVLCAVSATFFSIFKLSLSTFLLLFLSFYQSRKLAYIPLKSRCEHCKKNLFFCRVFFHSHRPCNLIYKTFILLKEESKKKDAFNVLNIKCSFDISCSSVINYRQRLHSRILHIVVKAAPSG